MKFLTRFAGALAGSIALFSVGATGLAAADVNITITNSPGAVVITGSEGCGGSCGSHTSSCDCWSNCHRHVVRCHWVWSCHRWCWKPCDSQSQIMPL